MDSHRLVTCEFDLGSENLSYLKKLQTQRAKKYGKIHLLYLHPEDYRRWLQAVRTKDYDMRRFRVRWGWAIRELNESWLVDDDYKLIRGV